MAHQTLTQPSAEELLDLLRDASLEPGDWSCFGIRMSRLGVALGHAYSVPPTKPTDRGTGLPPTSRPPSSDRLLPMTMYFIREDLPGKRWLSLFDATWPGYREWFLSQGSRVRPGNAECRSALEQHMPELVPTWERLCDLVRDDQAASMLSMWKPPPFAPGCSQLVAAGPPRHLVRNYDYDPGLFEQVVYSSRLTGRRVIGTGDCLWGLLDGMNDQGLVVSLTFGGRQSAGDGFAIPLVLRYLLEVCATIDDVKRVLRRVPVSAVYNITVADRAQAMTAFVSPDAPCEFTIAPLATNHRGCEPEDAAIARRLNSVERRDQLVVLSQEGTTPDQTAAAFLEPPLYNTKYSKGFGTLYTASYRPDAGTVEYCWPDARWRLGFASADQTFEVVLREPISP